MKAQIVEQVEFFSEAELESLEFVPEELEAIEADRVPDLESITFEDIAKDLEAYFKGDIKEASLERLPPELWTHILRFKSVAAIEKRLRYLTRQWQQSVHSGNMANLHRLHSEMTALRNQLRKLRRQLR